MNGRDVAKKAFQFAEWGEIPFAFEANKEQQDLLTARFGSDEWRSRAFKYFHYLPGIDHYLIDNGFTELPEGKKKDSFGCVWEFGNIHHLVGWPLVEPEMGDYRLPDLDSYFKTHIIPKWPDELALSENKFRIIRHTFGLYERSWSLRGFENFLMDIYLNRAFVDQLVETVADWMMESLSHILTCPIDAIYLTDDYADQRGVMFGIEKFREIFKPHWKRIFGKIKNAGVQVILHVCGNAAPAIPDLIECGLDCLQSLQPEAMDIYALKKEYGKDLRFWGGLGSQSILPFGTPEQVSAEIRKLKLEMGRGGGYVMSGAKSLSVGDVPFENVVAYYEEAIKPVTW
jgi:uroporphyrinogen decarboxylase